MSSCNGNQKWTEKSAYDVDTLRSRVGNLGLERRPVQHPAESENDVSEQSKNLDEACTFGSMNNLEMSELGDDDESFVIGSFNSEMSSVVNHAAMANYAEMAHRAPVPHRGGAENYVNARLPAHFQQRPMMQQNYGHQPHRYPPQATEHYRSQPTPPQPNYHHYPQESRPLLAHPNHPNQARHYQKTEFASPGSTNHHSNQEHHLENGFRSLTPDIGFQESLQDIAPPAPVPSRRPDPLPPVCSPDYSCQSSSPEYSRQISGSDCSLLDVKPEYTHQDSKESVGSDYSFTTIHPSYEDRSPIEQRSDERNRDLHAPVPTVSSQVSRNQTAARTTSTQPYYGPGPSHPRAPLPTPAVQPPPPPKPATPTERVKVFITYATEQENPHHARTMVQISQTLLQNSIDVGVDMLEENLRSMSSSEWLDNSISNSDFVLICVSPGYREVVEGQSTSSQSGYHHKERAIHTQYIYRRIHAEYIGNGSKNLRFIPVLMSGAELKHIPPWLRDTRVFEWPDNYQDIIFRLFRKERFVKPKPGPAPRHTVEPFSNYNERQNSRGSDRSDDHPTELRKA